MSENIEFLHIRQYDENNKVLNSGGFTLAFKEDNGVFKYAMAMCGPNDNFNKAYGRAKAGGRLNSPRYCAEFAGTRDEFLDYVLN